MLHARAIGPFILVLVALAACERSSSSGSASPKPPPPAPIVLAPDDPAAQPSAKELRPGVWRYTARGKIVALPGGPGTTQELEIHHEPLTTFYSVKGVNVGMKEMIMDFPAIAPGVSLTDFRIGDRIVFDFDVDWASKDVYIVSRMAKLAE